MFGNEENKGNIIAILIVLAIFLFTFFYQYQNIRNTIYGVVCSSYVRNVKKSLLTVATAHSEINPPAYKPLNIEYLYKESLINSYKKCGNGGFYFFNPGGRICCSFHDRNEFSRR